jgi:hypothetical protein
MQEQRGSVVTLLNGRQPLQPAEAVPGGSYSSVGRRGNFSATFSQSKQSYEPVVEMEKAL